MIPPVADGMVWQVECALFLFFSPGRVVYLRKYGGWKKFQTRFPGRINYQTMAVDLFSRQGQNIICREQNFKNCLADEMKKIILVCP
jgi:hypothetical protein